MRHVLIGGLLLALSGFLPPVRAQQDDPDGDAAQDTAEPGQVHRFKIHKHLFARSVYADKQGLCRATGNRQLRAWYVRGFPAEIPPFESCTTISSPTTSGDVGIELTIYDPRGRSILRIDGVLELPEDGQASQAVDWDHLKIPSPGKYFMEIKIEGKKAGRFPMLFKKKGGRRRKK